MSLRSWRLCGIQKYTKFPTKAQSTQSRCIEIITFLFLENISATQHGYSIIESVKTLNTSN
jgi:hypothetical protein